MRWERERERAARCQTNTESIQWSPESSLEERCCPSITILTARHPNLVPITALWKGSSLRDSMAPVGRGGGGVVGIL